MEGWYNMEKEIKKYKHNAIFAGQDIKCDKDIFIQAILTAIFGGIDFDLSKAVVNKDTVIKVRAIFGGVDIKVPDNVNIKVEPFSIFGGVTNKVKDKQESNDVPTLVIKTFCLFGGCDIK